jgi:hypothetical protein
MMTSPYIYAHARRGERGMRRGAPGACPAQNCSYFRCLSTCAQTPRIACELPVAPCDRAPRHRPQH